MYVQYVLRTQLRVLCSDGVGRFRANSSSRHRLNPTTTQSTSRPNPNSQRSRTSSARLSLNRCQICRFCLVANRIFPQTIHDATIPTPLPLWGRPIGMHHGGVVPLLFDEAAGLGGASRWRPRRGDILPKTDGVCSSRGVRRVSVDDPQICARHMYTILGATEDPRSPIIVRRRGGIWGTSGQDRRSLPCTPTIGNA